MKKNLPILLALAGSLVGQAPTTPAPKKVPAHPKTTQSSAQKAPATPAVTLPSEPGLYAVIQTSLGNIICKLYEKEAPKTVANFRGLAMGTKPWTDPKTGQKTKRPLYSGTIFHRVIPGFMIQGGDPLGSGMGDPGYKF